jgi:hypothetical protein
MFYPLLRFISFFLATQRPSNLPLACVSFRYSSLKILIPSFFRRLDRQVSRGRGRAKAVAILVTDSDRRYLLGMFSNVLDVGDLI